MTWHAPMLSEVRLTWLQSHQLSRMLKWWGPENNDWHMGDDVLPGSAILAALSPASRAALSPLNPQQGLHRINPTWFQLNERDRRTFRAVFFHDRINAVLTGGQREIDSPAKNWLRWLAVREAHAEVKSWVEARRIASRRLQGTIAAGKPGAMKWSYDRVQQILKRYPPG
jgi:hypothetical protein